MSSATQNFDRIINTEELKNLPLEQRFGKWRSCVLLEKKATRARAQREYLETMPDLCGQIVAHTPLALGIMRYITTHPGVTAPQLLVAFRDSDENELDRSITFVDRARYLDSRKEGYHEIYFLSEEGKRFLEEH